MSQVSYGTITITDTNDIERIYMVYAGSESNTNSPDVNNFTLWKTDVTQTSGTYIWQRVVAKKSGIEITATNFQQFYSDPVCVTGEGGRSIKSITTYYCNYGEGTPIENYNGWGIEVPEYDENKPNYWVKTVVIYVDDSEEEFELSGNIVTIEDGVHKQVTSVLTTIEPIQSGSGTPSPTNIRPISGHTECVMSVCGVNVWDEEWELGGLVNSTGLPYNATDRIRAKNFNPCVGGVTYFGFTATPYLSVFWYDASQAFISRIAVNKTTITAPSNARYFKLVLGNTTTYNNDTSINYPSTDHEYHAYNGNTYTTSLGRTVYGGTLDVVSGVLVVDRAYIDLGTLTWVSETSYLSGVFRSPASGWNPTPLFLGNLICSQYKGAKNPSFRINNGEISMTNSQASPILRVRDEEKTDMTASEFKTAMDGVQLVYELATPQTIQLTPQEVELLLGTNNLWTDCGDVSVNGFTIIDKDIQIRLDNGLTDAIAQSVEANANASDALDKANIANSIAQQTIEDAQGAMSQAASNVNEVKRIWYAQAAATPVPNAPTMGVTTSAAHDAWSITKPVADESYQYYFYCNQTKTGGGVYSWSEVILDTSTLSQYQIGAISAKVRNYWWDSAGAHIASGTSASSGSIDATSPVSAYGYNTLTGLTGISFRYNDAKVVDLNSTTPSLDFYQPPTISGSTVTQGKKTMMLSANALKFYNPNNGTTEQAVLDSNGLLLKEGGVKSGSVNAGNSGFIYLSTKDYGSNLTINGHQASNWREVIGTKFGVDADGNLYANNANISGQIEATSGSISNSVTIGGKAQSEYLNENISIGSRNLLRGTALIIIGSSITEGSWANAKFYKSGTGTLELVEYANPLSVAKVIKATTTTANTVIGFAQNTVPIIKDTVTLSAWVKGTAGDTVSLLCCYSDTSGEEEDGSKSYTILDGNWHRYEWSYTPTYDHSSSGIRAGYVRCMSATANRVFYICGVKLEYGNKATDWTPAPEDQEAYTDAAKASAISTAAADATTKANNAAKTATSYITSVDSNKGITIKPSDSSGNDYLLINSSEISFYRNNVVRARWQDDWLGMGDLSGSRVTIGTSNDNSYVFIGKPDNSQAFRASSSGVVVGDTTSGSRNVFISDSAMQIRNGTTVLAEYGSSIKLNNPSGTTVATINADGLNMTSGSITLGTTFSVTKAGALTAKSGTIGGWNIKDGYLDYGTWGADNGLLLMPSGSTGSSGTKSIGGSGNISGWTMSIGSKFGVTKTGVVYCSGLHMNAGYIGSWVVTGSLLEGFYTTGNTTYRSGIQLLSQSMELGAAAFYAGCTTETGGTIASEDVTNFYVNHLGYVHAKKYYCQDFKMMVEAGDVMDGLIWRGASYLTTSSTEIQVTVPINRIIVADTVTASNANLITRQNGQYTHGSSAGTRVAWTVNDCIRTVNGVRLSLKRTTTTNAVNNAPIGIDLQIKLVFS